ncbi:MAG: hypothetical protein E6K82_07910 [Candidatus Rokuibacteriota bacterium]|nr:MAG: hypothetical protein E6K82_07910 [Candidatus Rokubacteria bacterium]
MMEILDPTTEAATQTIAWAPRPTALTGKRVALIENTKFNSDKLLVKIGDLLKEEYGVAEWRLYHKHNASVPAHPEIIAEIETSADVVVAGIGD